MAHGTVIAAQTGGDTIVDYDLAAGGAYLTASGKVPASVLYVSTSGTTAPAPVTAANGLPVAQQGTWTVVVGAGSAAIGSVSVTGSVAVTGTFWQATQPVSAASLPLPTGAAADSSVNGLLVAQGSTTSGQKGTLHQGAVTTAAPTYTTGQTAPLSLDTTGNLRVLATATGTTTVSGTVTANAGTGTFAVSAASLPLPSGAATAAKQPALGTAGAASADVLTVQGVASMTALKVDGSAVTQPVSGTVTANIGTSGSLALDATLTGGTQKTKLVDSGGTNVATVSAGGALKVDASATTQPVSGTVAISGTPSTNATLQAGSNLIGQAIAAPQFGSVYSGTTSVPIQTAAISAALSGNNTIVAGVTGKKIYVLGAWFIPAGAVTATWKDSGGASLTGGFSLLANQPFSRATDVFAPQFVAGTGNDLVLNLNVAGQCSGVVVYVVF